MSWHKEIWTYLIVTLVAVLIWAWAASETRERKTELIGQLAKLKAAVQRVAA